MFIWFIVAANLVTSLIVNLVGSLLLICALYGAISELAGADKLMILNPLTWGAPLHWSWDDIWKAAVIGLLCFIVSTLRQIAAAQRQVRWELRHISMLLCVFSWTRRPNLNTAVLGFRNTPPSRFARFSAHAARSDMKQDDPGYINTGICVDPNGITRP